MEAIEGRFRPNLSMGLRSAMPALTKRMSRPLKAPADRGGNCLLTRDIACNRANHDDVIAQGSASGFNGCRVSAGDSDTRAFSEKLPRCFRPIPDVPPVMRARFPLSRSMGKSFQGRVTRKKVTRKMYRRPALPRNALLYCMPLLMKKFHRSCRKEDVRRSARSTAPKQIYSP